MGSDMKFIPVSYTHLDVYKRQVHCSCRIDDGCGSTAVCGNTLKFEKEN